MSSGEAIETIEIQSNYKYLAIPETDEIKYHDMKGKTKKKYLL